MPHLFGHNPGDGNASAVPLCVNTALVQAIQEFQLHGIIGAVPPQFNLDIDAYQHIDILHSVIFYNEFSIVPGDQLPERKHKIKKSGWQNISYRVC